MTNKSYNSKQKITFSLAFFPAWLIQGVFTVWVFSFYFSAVGLTIDYIMFAYVLWSVWNAINDPLIGYLSDRTRTRWGRRKPYLMIGLIPVLIIMIIIWIIPSQNQFINFIYLFIMLILFDFFFTMIAVPLDSLFPELYTSEAERAQVNTYRQIFSVIGLIGAFLIPSLFIGDISLSNGYLISGILIFFVGVITFTISLKYGITEREEFILDSNHKFSYFKGLKYMVKNEAFILYTSMLVGFEYIQLIQATLMPLFSKFILLQESTLIPGLLLGLSQIVALISIFAWKPIGIKTGSKIGYTIALSILFFAFIPLFFIRDLTSAIIIIIFSGLGFGGMLYFTTLLISDIIDSDELKTGIRREGSFFGITNFFMRLTGILSILTISLVFTTTGWEEYDLNQGIDVVYGLRMLMAAFPMIAIGIILLCLYLYPITKENVKTMKKQLIDLHQKKKEKVLNKK